MSLKPVFKPACPKCDFELRYHFRDPEMHPDKWVLTQESRDHLATGHLANVISLDTRRTSRPRYKKNIRKPRRAA